MKRFLVVAACVGVGFVFGIAFTGSTHTAKAGVGSAATQNGDTNGDGERDISDAVYLLQFLFSGGQDIAPIECPDQPPAPSFFVATGQTTCLGDAGPVACDIPKARGQDGTYRLGCPFDGRFVDNGDGTVTDNCTGLMWTKNNVDVDGDGEIILGFAEAKDDLLWADACRFAEDMTYLGHDDWRLPNIHEATSILDFGTNVGPAKFRPYPSVFDFAGMWSSTHEGTNGMAVGLHAGNFPDVRSFVTLHLGRALFPAVRGPITTP